MVASLLLLPFHLPPKTLVLNKPHSSSLPAFSSSSSSLKVKLPSLSSLSSSTCSSCFVTKVAVSSVFEQEEESTFSPDLKLFVGNLPYSVDSATLAGLFEQAGNVEMVEVIYDKQTGRSRGFGFVTMSTVEEVEVAAQQFNGYKLEGRLLRVNSGPPPPKEESRVSRGRGNNFNNANRVHVGNLSWDVDNSELESLFSEQGKVLDAKVIYDRESGRSRGFGFVAYSSEKEVQNAIFSLDGADLHGRSIRVTVADAKPRHQI